MSTINIKKSFLIGSRIKSLRKNHNISINQLGNLTGINQETLKNYEKNSSNPTIVNLIKLSAYFKVSVDFFIFGQETRYIQNLLLISIAEQIDKFDSSERYKVEGTAESLIGKENLKKELDIKIDSTNCQLGSNIHDNIKILREMKGFSQLKLAGLIESNQSNIAVFEKDMFPSLDKLIRLSSIFDYSIHALTTGNIVDASFKDQHLKETILRADHFLQLKEKDFLIHLMTRIIEDA